MRRSLNGREVRLVVGGWGDVLLSEGGFPYTVSSNTKPAIANSPTLGDPRMTTFLFKVPADDDILESGNDVPPRRNRCGGSGGGDGSVEVDLELRLCLASRYGLGEGVDLVERESD